jgi:hypothetical protein
MPHFVVSQLCRIQFASDKAVSNGGANLHPSTTYVSDGNSSSILFCNLSEQTRNGRGRSVGDESARARLPSMHGVPNSEDAMRRPDAHLFALRRSWPSLRLSRLPEDARSWEEQAEN